MKKLIMISVAISAMFLSACENTQSVQDAIADKVIEADSDKMRSLRATIFLASLSHVAWRESEDSGSALAAVGMMEQASRDIAYLINAAFSACNKNDISFADLQKCGIVGGTKNSPSLVLSQHTAPNLFNVPMLNVERDLLKLAKLALPQEDLKELLKVSSGNPVTLLLSASGAIEDVAKIVHIVNATARDGSDIQFHLLLTALKEKSIDDKAMELEKLYRGGDGARKEWVAKLKEIYGDDLMKENTIVMSPSALQFISAFQFLQANCKKVANRIELTQGSSMWTALQDQSITLCEMPDLENAIKQVVKSNG